MKESKQYLELDGFNSEHNIAFEHNGEQHYKHKPRYHKTIEAFEHQVARDKQKYNRCKKLGIKLFIIPELYSMTKIHNLHNVINKQIIKLGLEDKVVNPCTKEMIEEIIRKTK